MPDYQNGKIYKITSGDLTYIGSTCEPTLARRLAGHVGKYKHWKDGKTKEKGTSLPLIETGQYEITLIELFPCGSKDELTARERFHIETNVCVNKVIPTRTMTEYRIDNRKVIIKQMKAYNEANKEKLSEQKKAYYEANKEVRLEQMKAYKKANEDKIKAYKEVNKDKIKAYQEAYYESNKEANKEAKSKCDKAYREANKEAISLKKKEWYNLKKSL
jgi:hypothetical protein